MNIILNNLEQPDNLICFTDIPNILKITDTSGGTKAVFEITLTGNLKAQTTQDGQWYISFLGDTISNVLNASNAVNKNFYVSSSLRSTTASIVNAFRNCSTIGANFNVELIDNGDYTYSAKFTAKAVGPIWSDMTSYFDTNIVSQYITTSGTDGSANSPLYGSLITVDLYTLDTSGNSEYITTLEKNYYASEAAFNISPVLTTLAEYGDAIPYKLKISSMKDGTYALLGSVDTNYISIGYMANQGANYLFNDSLNVAQNYSRGHERDLANNTLLYLYEPKIDFSFYPGSASTMSIGVNFLDSAYNTLSSYTQSWQSDDSKLVDMSIDLAEMLGDENAEIYDKTFYVDLILGDNTIRYNVIKPIKATEYSQRILWRNSYGGISFFDFTGQKTESRDLTTMTYEKNIFDYYDESKHELEKVYDNDVKYTVTLKSHLFKEDGKYIFNDLLQSANVWTNINCIDYAIIIDSISVDETDNNGIYEATVKYHYSQEPSLI